MRRPAAVLRRIGVVALAVVLTVACGGEGGEPAGTPEAVPSAAGTELPTAAGELDPCALVTSAEVAEALGAPATAERPSEANYPPRMVTCRWVAPKGAAVGVMTLMIRTGADAAEARAGFQAARGQFPGAEAVSGIGEDAYMVANQLNVLAGDVHLILTGDFDAATTKKLAQSALQRVP